MRGDDNQQEGMFSYISPDDLRKLAAQRGFEGKPMLAGIQGSPIRQFFARICYLRAPMVVGRKPTARSQVGAREHPVPSRCPYSILSTSNRAHYVRRHRSQILRACI